MEHTQKPNWPQNQTIALQPESIVTPKETHRSHSILIKNGFVQEILQNTELEKKFPKNSIQTVAFPNHTVIPGLINAHTHAALSFLRDRTYEKANMIETLFFPYESHLSEDLIAPLAYPSLIDALKSGVTCLVDHYYFSRKIAKALKKIGLRGAIGETLADLGGAFPSKTSWNQTQKEIENWSHGEKITPVLCPHASNTVSKKILKEISDYARSQKIPIHSHLSQTEAEREACLKEHQMTPVEYYDSLGLLHEKSLLVHLISASTEDLKRIKEKGSTIGFCPNSQILYEKLAPIAEIVRKEIPIAIGTDCPSSNARMDVLSELKLTLLLMKDKLGFQFPVDAHTALEMITTHAAKALGLTHLGSIAPGKAADLVFIKNDLRRQPIEAPALNLILATDSASVEHVLIAGEWALWESEPAFASEIDLEAEFQNAYQTLKKRIRTI